MTPEQRCDAALDAAREYGNAFAFLCDRLPAGLREAVTTMVVGARAIDEVEDNTVIPAADRSRLLRLIAGRLIEDQPSVADLVDDPRLPELSQRLDLWIGVAPSDIRPIILATLSAAADRMAYWVDRGWNIETERDLEQYAYAVSGSFVQLFFELCTWHDGSTRPDHPSIRRYGRGISVGNMSLTRDEDLADGKGYLPNGWTEQQLVDTARSDLAFGTRFALDLPLRSAREFLGIYSAWYLVRVEEFCRVGRNRTMGRADFDKVVRAVVDGTPATVGRSSVEVPTSRRYG